MQQIKEYILKLKDSETVTKEQLLKLLEPLLDQELEQLMRKGEIFFPKKDVITRVGSSPLCEECKKVLGPADNCHHCTPEEVLSIGKCSTCQKKMIFLLKECPLCQECFQDYEKIILETGRSNLQLWTEDKT